ncbi:MAG: glycosyltransferase family 2 protein [Clostridia bacterium]
MKISIITVTYNSSKTLNQTLDSVLSQTYENFEHIIIDGASKDNTIDIVKSYEKKYKGKLKYISEKDSGLYDAMNKGIDMATGDVIGILNSDDIYANTNVLKTIANVFEEKKCDGIYGDLIFMDYESMKIPQRVWISKKGNIIKGWQPPHPTIYLKKEVYDIIGKFNLNYKIVSDYDFMIRLMTNSKINIEYINEVLIFMRSGGLSTNGIKGYIENLKESNIVLKNNNIKNYYFINFKRIVKTINQMLISKFTKKIK